jgi:ribokinase
LGDPPTLFVLGSFVAAISAKVRRLPSAGESLRAEAFVMEPGGKGFNLAVAARRLGMPVDGVFVIGDDVFSSLAEWAFARAELPPDMLISRPGPTGAGIGFIDAEGENCLAVYPGANMYLSAADIIAILPRLQKSRAVVAQFEIGDEPIATAFEEARKMDIVTILNPSPYRHIDDQILDNTAILIMNRVEAGQLAQELGVLTGRQLPTAPDDLSPLAQALLGRGLECVVVTLGAEGAVAWPRHGTPIRQPAFKIAPVDTLGAGDAFAAAFITALLDAAPLAECLRQGAASGALTLSKLGVFDALPTTERLLSFLDQARSAEKPIGLDGQCGV